MAGIKHTWTTTVKNDTGANVIGDVDILTAAAEENFSITVAGGNTTGEVDIDVDVSQIVSFFIESSVAVTLHTNTTPAGAQDFDLAAKKALGWNANDTVNVNPLTTDITKLYFVNAGTSSATIVGGFLLDV
jgi:hypothetical protein